MKRVGLLVALLGLVSLGAAPVSKNPENKEEPRVALPHRHPAEEMARLKEQALDGSWEAAAELESTYGFYSQIQEAIFWGMIAAENGKEGRVSRILCKRNFVLALRHPILELDGKPV